MKKTHKTAAHRKAELSAQRWEEAALKLSAVCTQFKMLLEAAHRRNRFNLAMQQAEFDQTLAEMSVDRAALEGSITELKKRLVNASMPSSRPLTDTDACRA